MLTQPYQVKALVKGLDARGEFGLSSKSKQVGVKAGVAIVQ